MTVFQIRRPGRQRPRGEVVLRMVGGRSASDVGDIAPLASPEPIGERLVRARARRPAHQHRALAAAAELASVLLVEIDRRPRWPGPQARRSPPCCRCCRCRRRRARRPLATDLVLDLAAAAAPLAADLVLELAAAPLAIGGRRRWRPARRSPAARPLAAMRSAGRAAASGSAQGAGAATHRRRARGCARCHRGRDRRLRAWRGARAHGAL